MRQLTKYFLSIILIIFTLTFTTKSYSQPNKNSQKEKKSINTAEIINSPNAIIQQTVNGVNKIEIKQITNKLEFINEKSNYTKDSSGLITTNLVFGSRLGLAFSKAEVFLQFNEPYYDINGAICFFGSGGIVASGYYNGIKLENNYSFDFLAEDMIAGNYIIITVRSQNLLTKPKTMILSP